MSAASAIVAVSVGRPAELPYRGGTVRTAFLKERRSGEVVVGPLGLDGDEVSDTRHHGGVDQAVYAFAREDLDAWAERLGRDVRDGQFGENLTTEGIDVNEAEVGERWRVGTAGEGGVPRSTLELVGLRVSQINGCTACVQGHVEEARAAGASDEKVMTVAAWIDSPYFDEDERLALALADSLTRVADRSDDPVPDDLWAAVTARYDERQVSALLLQTGTLNLFNRLNVAVKEQADHPSWKRQP